MQNSNHQIERIHWIDLARGISIIAVILYHTESYYIDVYHVFQYNWLCNFLKVFFFLSGYLLYKENQVYDNRFISYKIKRIFRTLVIPYFIFTTIMALPKVYYHGLALDDVLMDIILGNASWFVATLISAELLFILIFRLNHLINAHIILAIISILGLIVVPFIDSITFDPWCYLQCSVVTIFLFLGFVFHEYESYLKKLNWYYVLFITTIFIIILKMIVYRENITLSIYPLDINNILFYVFDGLIGILLIVSLSKIILSNRIIEYTGKLSIIIYFLNGGISIITSNIMNKIGFSYNEYYYRVIMVFIINYIILFIIAHIIYQYFPFIIGKRKDNE